MDKTTKQASVSARDLPTLDEPLQIARTITTQPFSKKALKVLLVLLRDRGRPNPLLSREEELISGLAGNYSDDVVLNRQDISDIAHANNFLCSSSYDIIHFSGQRADDIYLESSHIHQQLTMLEAHRCLHALESAPRLPKLVVFISCFSRQLADILSECAPFVISADLCVGDEERIAFVKHFYANLFATQSVTGSFEHATRMSRTEGLYAEAFALHRPELTKKRSKFIYQMLSPGR